MNVPFPATAGHAGASTTVHIIPVIAFKSPKEILSVVTAIACEKAVLPALDSFFLSFIAGWYGSASASAVMQMQPKGAARALSWTHGLAHVACL